MTLEGVRLAVATAMLLGASVLDLRERRVRNGYWLPFVAGAAGLAAIEVPERLRAGMGTGILVAAGAATLLCGLAWTLWRLRLFGGADAKAIMVLAVLLPWPGQVDAVGPLAVLATPTIVLLGSLAVVALPVGLLLWNGAHGRWRLPAALLGVPMAIADARRSHVWPMQDVAEDGRVVWRYWVRVGTDAEARYARLEAAGLATVWTTAKVPFMVPLLFGTLIWAGLWMAGGVRCIPC